MDDIFRAFDRVWLSFRVVGYVMVVGLATWIALTA